jgi:ABC-type molybdate transport system substrate-binding protein
MKEPLYKIAEEHLGMRGKMISFSKSGYAQKNPDNLVVFNSNVCTDEGKVWYGDLDVTLSYDSLSDLAKETGKTVYVLTESDGRFENEETPLLNRAVVKFLSEGGHEVTSPLSYYKKFNLKNQ